MLVFDRENWPYHRGWFLFVVAASLAAAGWYLVYGFAGGSWAWPSGASPPGFVYGAIGGLITAFEMLLWPRKSLWRGWRIGRTKLWMTMHLWLGLLTLPLLLLHGSFQFNVSASALAAVLMWLLVAVVGSGVFGLVVQNIVPRVMFEQLPAETIASQIPRVLETYRADALRMVEVVCGIAPSESVAAGEARGMVAVETVRQVGRVQGLVVEAELEAEFTPGSESLLEFHRRHVDPYLSAPVGTALELGSPRQAVLLFEEVKRQIRPSAHPVVDRLADLCNQRRQFDLQLRLHRLLHTWLGVHVALSVALFVLMIAHIFLAMKYV